MCEEGLVEMEPLGIISDHNKTRTTKVQALLNAVESSSEPNAFAQFAECVEKEKGHLGHSYIAKLLLGEEFPIGMHDDMRSSAKYKKQCMQGFKTLICNFNVEGLIPMLYAERLLTADEFERLTNPAIPMTRQDKVSFACA